MCYILFFFLLLQTFFFFHLCSAVSVLTEVISFPTTAYLSEFMAPYFPVFSINLIFIYLVVSLLINEWEFYNIILCPLSTLYTNYKFSPVLFIPCLGIGYLSSTKFFLYFSNLSVVTSLKEALHFPLAVSLLPDFFEVYSVSLCTVIKLWSNPCLLLDKTNNLKSAINCLIIA